MDYCIVDLTPDNVGDYDLFCQKSKKKSIQYQQKLSYFEKYYPKGLRLKILYVDEERKSMSSRGFIEYIPSEFSWRGIFAQNVMVIHCLFIVGRQKGKGYGKELVQQVIEVSKAQQKNGVAVLGTKSTWLTKSSFYRKMGFEKIDTYPPNIDLLYLPLKDGPIPEFSSTIKNKDDMNPIDVVNDITIYRSPQCPYTLEMSEFIKNFASEHRLSVKFVEIDNHNDAQNALHPYGTFYVTINGQVYDYRPNPKYFVKNLPLVE